jgi:hypothetical protein
MNNSERFGSFPSSGAAVYTVVKGFDPRSVGSKAESPRDLGLSPCW